MVKNGLDSFTSPIALSPYVSLHQSLLPVVYFCNPIISSYETCKLFKLLEKDAISMIYRTNFAVRHQHVEQTFVHIFAND